MNKRDDSKNKPMNQNEIAWLQRIESRIHDDKIALAKTATRLEDVATALSKIASRLEEIKYEKEAPTGKKV